MSWNCDKQLSDLSIANCENSYRSVIVPGNPGKRPMNMANEKSAKRARVDEDSESEAEGEEEGEEEGEAESEAEGEEEDEEEGESDDEDEEEVSESDDDSDDESTDDEFEDRKEMMEKIDHYMEKVLHVNPYGTPYDKEDPLAHLSFDEHQELVVENKRIDAIMKKEQEEKNKLIDQMFSKPSAATSSSRRVVPPGKRAKPQPSKRKRE